VKWKGTSRSNLTRLEIISQFPTNEIGVLEMWQSITNNRNRINIYHRNPSRRYLHEIFSTVGCYRNEHGVPLPSNPPGANSQLIGGYPICWINASGELRFTLGRLIISIDAHVFFLASSPKSLSAFQHKTIHQKAFKNTLDYQTLVLNTDFIKDYNCTFFQPFLNSVDGEIGILITRQLFSSFLQNCHLHNVVLELLVFHCREIAIE
jgi:hypothetical protein